MLEVIAGVIAGIIGGIGLGGSTILILILSMFMGIEQHISQATNIIFFIPMAIISVLLNIKHKLIKWKIAIPIIIAGVIGAVIGAKFAIQADSLHLKRYFGIFLSLIAIYEIYYLFIEYKNKRKSNNTINDAKKHKYPD